MSSSTKVHPVAIIGGGPVGLTSSILLSLRGIPHVLFERRAGTSIHPKACGINQRTTEIFRVLGIEEDVYQVSAPPSIAGRTAWYTSLGPAGREIVSRDAWGLGQYADEYETFSPSRYAILPQIRLEPIIQRRALELNPDGVRYGAEVTAVRERGADVVLKVKHAAKDEEEEVVARFVIAADGGRSITDHLGIPWLGEKNIFEMVSAHLRAPIRSRHPDPRNFITWFTHPETGGSMKTGFLYQIGPWPLEQHPEEADEWVFACAPVGVDPKRFDADAMVARLRSTLKIPDLPIDVISLSHWSVNAISAERYRSRGGRVFLVGDAAHRIPPWGALGMNTGAQDAQNLVWKLELALKEDGGGDGGEGGKNRYDGLLDSYDAERRPVGTRVGLSSLHNVRSHGLAIDAALGMSGDKSPAENAAAVAPFFDESHPEHRSKKEAVARASKVLDSEFKAPGTEVGWFYPQADFWEEGKGNRHGGQLLDDGELDTEFYHPSTIPGHHLPHAWVEKDGRKIALRDLIPLSKLLLIARTTGLWEAFESELVHVEVIGEGGRFTDKDGEWARQCGVSDRGAVLVRPDGIVAWRGDWDDGMLQRWLEVINRILYLAKE